MSFASTSSRTAFVQLSIKVSFLVPQSRVPTWSTSVTPSIFSNTHNTSKIKPFFFDVIGNTIQGGAYVIAHK